MGKFLKKIAIILVVMAIVIGISKIAYKVNMSTYETRADERINKVIQLQGASLESAKVVVDGYDSKNGCWYKRIVFDDDPEINYDYEYNKSDNEVRIWRADGNVSLDLSDKEAKYPEYDVIFEKDQVKEIIERNY